MKAAIARERLLTGGRKKAPAEAETPARELHEEQGMREGGVNGCWWRERFWVLGLGFGGGGEGVKNH